MISQQFPGRNDLVSYSIKTTPENNTRAIFPAKPLPRTLHNLAKNGTFSGTPLSKYDSEPASHNNFIQEKSLKQKQSSISMFEYCSKNLNRVKMKFKKKND